MRMLGRMLGTSDEDGHQLVEWGDALLGNTDPDFTDFPVDLVDTEEFRLMPFRSPAAIEIFDYASKMADERRAHPTDDVITQLLAPTKDGTPLTDLEFKDNRPPHWTPNLAPSQVKATDYRGEVCLPRPPSKYVRAVPRRAMPSR